MRHTVLLAFGMRIRLSWQPIAIFNTAQPTHDCRKNQFYLSLPGIARFLALPEKSCIMIERAHPDVSFDLLKTWLLGTIMAYYLQYHGYLVLHGSAVLMNNRAVIFSGPSGVGKSTLAHACVRKGYNLITDDLVVIKRNERGHYGMLPGPAQVKLWKDAMQYFNCDMKQATLVNLQADKYALSVASVASTHLIP